MSRNSWKLLRVILVALSPSGIISLVTVVLFKCPDSVCSLWRPFVKGPNLSRVSVLLSTDVLWKHGTSRGLLFLPYIPSPERRGNCYHVNEYGLLERTVLMFFPTNSHPSYGTEEKRIWDQLFSPMHNHVFLFIKVIFGLTGPIWDPLVEEPPSFIVKLSVWLS